MRVKGTIAVVFGALMLTACSSPAAPYEEKTISGTIERIERYEASSPFTSRGTNFGLQGSETIYTCQKVDFLLCMLLKVGDEVEIGYGDYDGLKNQVSSLSIAGYTPAK